MEAILNLKSRNDTKELKSFLVAIQYLAKFLPKLSEKTDRLRKLLEKNGPWKWEKGQAEVVIQIKRMITEKPPWAFTQKIKKIWSQRTQVKPDSESHFGKSKIMEI